MQEILKSVKLTNVNHNDCDIVCYDFSVEIKQNTFKFEGVSDDGRDIDNLSIDGNDISTDNLHDMYFNIDGKMMALGVVLDLCDNEDLEYKVHDFVAEDATAEGIESAMREELSSPYLTGRV